MAVKARYNVSLPDHVSAEIEKHAQGIGATPTEYAGDIIRWWFGQGAPAVRPDEQELRKRIKPVPADLNVWKLNPDDAFVLTDDAVVQRLLVQLGLPNLFAHVIEHDEIRSTIAFDNHPTHWLVVNMFKGSNAPGGDGLSLEALPKATFGKKQMIKRLEHVAKEMRADGPINFSQIPMVAAEKSAT